MPLASGTVSVNGTTGARTGSGLALALYDLAVDNFDPDDASVNNGWTNYEPAAWKAVIIGFRQQLATRSQGTADAIAAMVGAADVRVPTDAFGTGVPASPVVLSGAVE